MDYVKLDKKGIKKFKEIVNTINNYVNETILSITQEELKIKFMDMLKVCLFDIIFKKSFFSEYNINKDYEIGINVKELRETLKTFKEELYINFTDTEIILISGGVEYHLNNIKICEEENTNLDLEFKLNTKINFKDFIKHIKTFSNFTEKIILFNNENILLLTDEEYKNKIVLKETFLGKKIKSAYSIDYLIKLKNLKFEKCMIYLNNDYPLKIVFCENDKYKIEFYLAPQINGD